MKWVKWYCRDVALPEFCAWVVSNPWLSAYKKALKTHIIDIIQTTRLFNDINARYLHLIMSGAFPSSHL